MGLALTFEHETAAIHRLAGFGDLVEVLEPLEVRARLVITAQAIIDRYRNASG
jgi:predicted DNA-binding transcriptional regulator YafY